MKKAIVIILIVLLVGGFLFGAFMLAKTLITAQKEKDTFDSLVRIIDSDKGDEVGDNGILRKYDPLYEQNKDFFGWIKIEDTQIDYPVMYTPWDNEYYIHRDFYGGYSESGCIFIDGSCLEKGNFYLLYGHHMRNGSMFGELPNYQKYDFYQDHKIIFFDTRYELRDYEVVAAFYGKIYPEEEEPYHFCYYKYTDLSDPSTFSEYVANVKSLSLYDTGIYPVYGDELIALSTCNYHTEDGRFVVVARRMTDHVPKAE